MITYNETTTGLRFDSGTFKGTISVDNPLLNSSSTSDLLTDKRILALESAVALVIDKIVEEWKQSSNKESEGE